MNIPWVEVDPPARLADFLRPGHLLVLTTSERLWVGDINGVGGVCDDCQHEAMHPRSEARVVAYWNATIATPVLETGGDDANV